MQDSIKTYIVKILELKAVGVVIHSFRLQHVWLGIICKLIIAGGVDRIVGPL
jgi:hypothetical protein